jgi:hypothetical protein
MNKYERRNWFERLIELREQYRAAGETVGVMSIDEAIAFAEQELCAPASAEPVFDQ